MVKLEDITIKNFNDVINIHLNENDKRMVAPNMYSLAEAYADKVSVPNAIYNDDVLVGFIMYDYDVSEKIGYISRLMIGSKHQNKGYGRDAMIQVINILKKNKDMVEIRLAYSPNNDKARALYYSLGFRETGEMDQGEVVAVLRLGVESNE